jgi:outer membrane protein with beta-barrel domain
MRRLGLLGAVIAALLFPAAARAQFTLGARAGYAFGWGDVGGTLGVGDWVSSQVPLQVDALYRVNPRLALGAYFSYGFAQTGGAASDLCGLQGTDCSANVRRFGVQAAYALAPHDRVEPWIGANIGYEWNTLEVTDPTGTVKTEFKGWEYLGLQAGADWRLGAKIAAGPFLHASLARYGEGDISDSSGSGGGSIDSKKLHGWITLGVRVKLDL